MALLPKAEGRAQDAVGVLALRDTQGAGDSIDGFVDGGMVRDAVEEISEGFGMTLQDLTPQIARRLSLPRDTTGAVVVDVASDSTAESVGVQPGDVIITVNRVEVTSAADRGGAGTLRWCLGPWLREVLPAAVAGRPRFEKKLFPSSRNGEIFLRYF